MNIDDRHGFLDHPPIPCLRCGELIDSATEVTSQLGVPDPDGVPVICCGCGEINIYRRTATGFTFREPTIAELRRINTYFGPVLAQVHQWRIQQGTPEQVRGTETKEPRSGE